MDPIQRATRALSLYANLTEKVMVYRPDILDETIVSAVQYLVLPVEQKLNEKWHVAHAILGKLVDEEMWADIYQEIPPAKPEHSVFISGFFIGTIEQLVHELEGMVYFGEATNTPVSEYDVIRHIGARLMTLDSHIQCLIDTIRDSEQHPLIQIPFNVSMKYAHYFNSDEWFGLGNLDLRESFGL